MPIVLILVVILLSALAYMERNRSIKSEAGVILSLKQKPDRRGIFLTFTNHCHKAIRLELNRYIFQGSIVVLLQDQTWATFYQKEYWNQRSIGIIGNPLVDISSGASISWDIAYNDLVDTNGKPVSIESANFSHAFAVLEQYSPIIDPSLLFSVGMRQDVNSSVYSTLEDK